MNHLNSALRLLGHIVEGEVFLPGEIDQAKTLLAKHAKFKGDIDEHNVDAAKREIIALKDAYRQNPTDENKRLMKEAELNRDHLKDKNQQIRATIRRAMADFIQKEYRPFFTTIIYRMREAAVEVINLRKENIKQVAEKYGIDGIEDDAILLAMIMARNDAASICHVDLDYETFKLPAGFPTIFDALQDAAKSFHETDERLAQQYAREAAELAELWRREHPEAVGKDG